MYLVIMKDGMIELVSDTPFRRAYAKVNGYRQICLIDGWDEINAWSNLCEYTNWCSYFVPVCQVTFGWDSF